MWPHQVARVYGRPEDKFGNLGGDHAGKYVVHDHGDMLI